MVAATPIYKTKRASSFNSLQALSGKRMPQFDGTGKTQSHQTFAMNLLNRVQEAVSAWCALY